MGVQPPFPQPPGNRFEQLLGSLADGVRKLQARTSVLDPGSLVCARSGTIPGTYTSGQPTVVFAGQTAASGPFPVYQGYTPAANDTVLCLPLGQSYIVIGKYA